MTDHKALLTIARELTGYGFVSAIALIVDAGCLLLLAKHLHYLAAATISFILGGVVAYLLSVKFVFANRRMTRTSTEFGLFISLGLVGLGVNALIIGLAVSHWSLSLGASKMLAALGTFTCNFSLRKSLLFSRTHCGQRADVLPIQ